MQTKTMKKSRQRDAIYDFLMTRKDHPTADFIYENVRKTFPNISLGTVYRNLNLLVELGQAQRFSTYDGYDHFDGNPAPHYHFVCNRCRCVLDLDTPTDDGLEALASSCFGGKIEGHTVLFNGLCPACMSSENPSENN